MPVRDEFAQDHRLDHSLDHPLPVFLTGDSQRFEDEQGSSLLLKMSLLVVATIAIGVVMMLALGLPLPKSFFADATPTDPPAAARLITDQSTTSTPPAPPTQPTSPAAADAGPTLASVPSAAASAPSAAAPATSDTTAASDDTSDGQAAAPASGDLLKRFQSWAAAQDSQPPAAPAPSAPEQVEAIRPIQSSEPVRPIQGATQQADPAQDAPTTQIIQDNSTPVRAVHKHHKPPAAQNARAEIGTPKVLHPTARPTARADARPAQPQEQPPPPAQPPSLLQSLGLKPQQ